jgi:NTE family protein
MPVRIGGRDYVDGGIYSPSNLDLLRAEGLDLVICLNPTSTIDEIPVTSPLHRMAAAVRGASGRRLGREAGRVRAGGARVLLVQPTREDVQTMGPNLMSGRNRHQVVLTAARTTAERLREPEARDLLAGLPAGAPHKVARPNGPPSAWPELAPEAPA